MTATLLNFPGYGPSIRALQDAKSSPEIRHHASANIAAAIASMTGDTAPEDLTMAEPGTPRMIPPHAPPAIDYAPDPREPEPFSWIADFGDGLATAALFVALGAVGGLMAAAWVVLPYIMAVAK